MGLFSKIFGSKEPTDKEMEEMYLKIAPQFVRVAAERNEQISTKALANITSKFLFMKPSVTNEYFEEHLAYELEKYRKEGLRPDYMK